MQHIEKWSHFFEAFAALRQEPDPQPEIRISAHDAAVFFSAFSSSLTQFRQQGRAVDFVQLAGIGRDELHNSALLAWLLDCSGNHGQGTVFLRCLLSCICKNYPEWQDISNCLVNSGVCGNYRTFIESSYDEDPLADTGKCRSRLDIEIDGPDFLILIEVKIQASETDNQLERYMRIGRARAGKRPWILSFLTPDGHSPGNGFSDGNVVCLDWPSLGQSFLQHVSLMPKDSHGTMIIQQFCEHITRL